MDTSSTQRRLRSSVTFTRGVRLDDRRTGLRLELGPDAAAVLEALQAGAPLPDGEEVTQFVGELRALGLLDDGTSLRAMQARQGEFVIRQAYDEQMPDLVEAVERAVQRTRFHRARLSGMEVHNLEDLQRLPLMFKSDLRTRLSELIAEGTNVPGLMDSGDLAFSATSGSTGDRLQVISDTRLSALPPGFEELWGLEPRWEQDLPRTAVFTSPVCAGPVCHIGKAPMDERIVAGNTLFLNSTDDIFAITRELADNIFSELWRFSPDFLVANPVYLAVLAERAVEWNLKLPPFSAIISTYQFLSRCQRRVLRRHFECPVFDFLAATDLGGSKLAVECVHGSKHLRLDHGVTEVIRGGKQAAPGELGYFVVTTMNEVLPLVRYVLGDLGRLHASPCRCNAGSSWPRVILEGRAADMLWLGDRFATVRAVDDSMAEAPVDFYQLKQLVDGGFELKIVPSAGRTNAREAAREALVPLLGSAQVHVEMVTRLRPEAGQKFRLTIPARLHRDALGVEYPGLSDDLLDRHGTS